MRRSAAPSQAGVVQKRPRFAPPFLGTSSVQPTIENAEKPNGSFEYANKSEKDGCRSSDEILNLIQMEQSPLDQPESQQNGNNLPTSESSCSVNSAPNVQFDRSNSRSSMFEVFNNIASPVGTPHNTSDGNAEQPARYLSVMWCKLSKKKHKTWEGDAILIVRGRTATLVDMEGKEIGQGSGYKISQLQELTDGHMLVIGSKQIEVMGELSEEQFKSGKCFQFAAPPPVEATSLPSVAAVVKPFVNPLKDGSIQNFSNAIKKVMPMLKIDVNDPDVLVMPRPSDSHQWQHNTNNSAVTDVVLESGIARHLRPHQREGIIFMYQCIMGMKSHRGCGTVLADEMGLGKTLQCIALIWMLYRQGPYGGKPVLRKILIITPGSLVKNWCKEFKKWLNLRLSVFAVGPDKKVEDFPNQSDCPVLIISYEMFVRNNELIQGMKFDLLICDEGHRLKNTNIKTTSFVNGLSINRRIVLTGTPIQNDLQELFSIVDFVNPGVLGTVGAFRHVYEDPILSSRKPSATNEEILIGQTRATELSRITGLFILRRTQEINNKYLPPKADIVLFCGLTDLQLVLYKKLLSSRAVKSCISDYCTSETAQHLCCISALKKLCNHPDLIYKSASENAEEDLLSDSSDVNKSLYAGLDRLFPNDYANECDRTRHSSKLSVLSDLLRSFHQSPSERVVIVSNSTKTLDIIESLCKGLGYNSIRLDGNTPVNKRQQLVDRFNNHHLPDFVFLLSTKAGGVGLNLIGASRLVLFDIDWNPATDLQAMARVWRDGQKRKAYIYRLISTDTIEEKIYQRQISKQGLSGVVVDAKTSDSKQTFTPEQLRELFQVPEGRLCGTHDLLNCECLKEEEEDSVEKPAASLSSVAPPTIIRPCQLMANKLVQNNQKNACMDELLKWKHIEGPSPSLIHVDPLFPADEMPQVTFAFWTESNKQCTDS